MSGHPLWAHLHTVEGSVFILTVALMLPAPVPTSPETSHPSLPFTITNAGPLVLHAGSLGAWSSAFPILEILLNWLGSLCLWKVGGGSLAL